MASFHPFPRLPAELRIRVWELTVEPRTVDVRVIRNHAYLRTDSVSWLVSSTPVPGPLQTCREARYQGLYTQGFSEFAGPPDLGLPYVWINWDIDTISIGPTLFEEYMPVAPLFQRLKFERENSDHFYYYREAEEIRIFRNVKEIYVVCADGYWAWVNCLEEQDWPCGPENVFFIEPRDGCVIRGPDFVGVVEKEMEADWSENR